MLKMRQAKPKSRRHSSMAMKSTSTSRRYESSSKICEPMCACTPTSSRWGASLRRRTASCARPSASPKPNLLSCWPVWMKSCVLGRTPGVTRTSTSWERPRAAAAASSRSISSNESTTKWPMPASRPASISAGDLLLPWK